MIDGWFLIFNLIMALLLQQLRRQAFSSSKVHTSNNLKRVLADREASFKATAPQRNDTLRYSYLKAESKFSDLGDRLHPDLKSALSSGNFDFMTDVQSQAVRAGLLEG
jgi:superfamily II helicase